jgi:RNA polymerase sigma-70 factor (ECF subfamily)
MKSSGAAVPASSVRLHDLLVAVAEGDQPALEQLYRHTCDKLYGVVWRILRERVMAEDALAEAYLRIWQRPRDYDPKLMDPMSWMVAVARRCALDLARRTYVFGHEAAREGPEIKTEESESAVEQEISDELKRLFSSLATLPEDQRVMLLLAYYDGWGRDSLAVEFDAPADTIRTWLLGSLDQLRQGAGQ